MSDPASWDAAGDPADSTHPATAVIASPTDTGAHSPARGAPSAQAAPAAPASQTSSVREYGLWAVIAGLVVLAGLDAVVLAIFHSNINSAVGLIGTISTPIVAMVSAYFGIKVGAQTSAVHAAASEQARKKSSEQARKKSSDQALAFLGQLTPEQARPVLQKLGIPTG